MMNPERDKQAPLTGIRVVDFGHYIAGPLTGMLLADQGAEVIKVDRPGKPDYDTPANGVFNRGKQHITLDLKNADDLAMAVKLICSADVVIENFRPGVMLRLGLGAEEMTALNPGLVYLSLPGFASTDERAPIRAFEGIISAAIGQYTDLQSRRPDLPPVYTPMPLGSTYGAIHGAIAVTLALYAREESGRGDVIEVSLIGAAMSAMAVIMLDVADKPARYGTPSNAKRQKKHSSAGSPFSGTFRAGDGQWLYIIAAGHSRNSRSLVKALEVYDDLTAEGMVDVPVYENLHLTNNIPDSSHLSREWNLKARKKIERVLASEPAQHWVDVLTAAGVPCTIQRTAQEWLHKSETEEAALTVVVDDPDYGSMRQLGVQTWLSKTPDECAIPRPSETYPQMKASNELLTQLYNAPSMTQMNADGSFAGGGESKSMEAAKPILKGIRVLDLSNVLAGPASARTLAEYGAEVIKIDPPEPYFGPRISSWFPLEVSPGKRSVILNLKDEAGRAAFMKLVETADVIVHNFRPGVAQSLGIDYDAVKRRKPDIVYLNLTAFNGPRPGPWMNRPGFDPLLQGSTGIQMRYAGEGNRPILHGWASCIDYITGYSATYGAVLALLKRRRSGVPDGGDFVTTSLAQGGQLVQAPFMFACEAGCSGDEPSGQDAVGEHALHRMYRARDGWVFLGGLPHEMDNLRCIAGLENTPDEDAGEFLEGEIKKRDVGHWVKAFNEVGLAGHRIDSLEDIREMFLHEVCDENLDAWDDGRSISIVRFTDHPAGSAVDLAPPAYVRLKNAPVQLLYACPKQGAHTREILGELGYDSDYVDDLIAKGIAKEQLHEYYLPH